MRDEIALSSQLLVVYFSIHGKVAMNGEQENPNFFHVHFDFKKANRLTDNQEQIMRMVRSRKTDVPQNDKVFFRSITKLLLRNNHQTGEFITKSSNA